MKSVDFRNDPMFLRNQFARDGTFEMPVIKKTKLDLDDIEFIGYDKLNEGQTDKIVHFSWTTTSLKFSGKTQSHASRS